MKRLFTLFFAAYGLAVYGQDNLIGEVYLSFQSSYNTVAIDGCEVGLSYMLQIEGTYGIANGSCNRDAAFGNFGNPTPHCQWVWNDVCDGCQDHRPTPDGYNPDHAYSYPFIAVSSEQTFHFQDLGGAGDNCGGLTMRIFTAGNVGCMSTSACNYDSEAVHDDGSCLYPDACGECEGNGLAGCTDALACNFNEDATCDDGGCDYSCCPGPGCCLDGQHWDWELGGCVITNPADINHDGCVQLNDLLDLLGAYGDCGAIESPWQCGDPLEYQGYDYETVQIGEQCWFAENLRVEKFNNGDSIPFAFHAGNWGILESALATTYGEGEISLCNNYSDYVEEFDACDESLSLGQFGLLYNWFATQDERGVCPSGWQIPSNQDWVNFEVAVEDSISGSFGQALMSTDFWEGDPGTNALGWGGLPGGCRYSTGHFQWAGRVGYWWSSDNDGNNGYFRRLDYDSDELIQMSSEYGFNSNFGFSVRCMKNVE